MNLESLISLDYELEGNENWLHSREHDSLVIDVKKQLFFWNSRGISGDSYSWLTKVKGMSHDSAKEYLKQNDKRNAYSFVQTIRNSEEVVVYPKLVDVFYEQGLVNNQEYWLKRGLSNSTIQRFRLGFHNDWYMIPVYQDGLFRNFQCRKEVPNKQIKSYYKNVGPLLFNSDILRVTSKIYIAEGPTDCLRLMQEGVPCISHTAGSEGWQDSWFKYFIQQKEIYVIYDNDSAGKIGAKKVAKALGEYRCKVFTFDGFEPKFDIIDFFNSGGEIKDFLELVDKEARYAFQ